MSLEIKASMLFNLFANNTILSQFYFLITNLYFLISASIIQIFNPTAKFSIPIELLTETNKTKAEETQAVIV